MTYLSDARASRVRTDDLLRPSERELREKAEKARPERHAQGFVVNYEDMGPASDLCRIVELWPVRPIRLRLLHPIRWTDRYGTDG